MKIAVIGKGKTGQAVIDLLGQANIYDVFDSKNVVSVEKLKNADAIIVFVSGEVLAEILDILLTVDMPVICGTTGFKYTKQVIQRVNDKNHTWIVANNFSLSMVFIKEALASLGKLKSLIPQAEYSIVETHHTKKLDAPSGTALAWQQWLEEECDISSKRLADVKGIHELCIDYAYETIEFKHTAHDRKLFGEGAVWAARYAINNPKLVGFHHFETLVKESIDANK